MTRLPFTQHYLAISHKGKTTPDDPSASDAIAVLPALSPPDKPNHRTPPLPVGTSDQPASDLRRPLVPHHHMPTLYRPYPMCD